MADGNKREGVSVRDVEDFAKRHRFEVVFCLMFFFAAIFSFMNFFGPGWSIILAAVGGIVSIVFPVKADETLRTMMRFLVKQETTMQIVLGVVCVLISIFLPLVVFLLIGAFAGKGMYQMAMESSR